MLRGVQPTYETDTKVVLCKSSPSIRNTYEIRLVIYFAVKSQKAFELWVPADAVIEPSITTLISKVGGSIRKQECRDFSISVTHFDSSEIEKDSWVLGDRDQWIRFKDALHSPWLKSSLKVGASFSSDLLKRLDEELSKEQVSLKNIDDENIQIALSRLIQECRSQGGSIVIQ